MGLLEDPIHTESWVFLSPKEELLDIGAANVFVTLGVVKILASGAIRTIPVFKELAAGLALIVEIDMRLDSQLVMTMSKRALKTSKIRK